MLRENGYPRSLVSRLAYEWSPGGASGAVRTPQDGEQAMYYARLMYIQDISPRLRVLLRREIPRAKLVFRYGNKVSRMHSRLKSEDPAELSSGVVYKVPCSNCPASYVGHTISYLKVRMARHRLDCRGDPEEGTMLSHHALTLGHEFDFAGVSILDREKQRSRREFKEKLYIQMTDQSCNKRTDVNGISSVYAGILAVIKPLMQ
ncbi:Hypothetical protein NTJ_02657 [Nesidiocoris tenuis]|uniref:Uncharacterized protein n=1 Tax=Nesidiocoris tenuis TaxID=355587 RepID=A0ABN7AG76_9HEMI|nr:Hypothetical protein NTJ_02657 [Nesidiocoris tenuis]